jgi:mRNA-degrading endonuclease RelE of RelBE toxin-antitoxin system
MNRGNCPLEDELFSTAKDAYTNDRLSLNEQLKRLASNGFNTEGFYSKIANRENGIYELRPGDLRLLYFKGNHPNIIVCTDIHIKKGQRANPLAVKQAIRIKKDYLKALKDGDINIIED